MSAAADAVRRPHRLLVGTLALAAITLVVWAPSSRHLGQGMSVLSLCTSSAVGQELQPCHFNTLLRQGDVHWSTRNGSADQLHVASCKLRRYTASEARQCLAGKTIVLLGDSVTRFQYVVLAYFLHAGQWPPPFGGVPGQPSLANSHEWHSISAYTTGTNALFGGQELCQCPPHFAGTDNRHYMPEGGRFSLHFFRYSDAAREGWANGDVYGFYRFPPFANKTASCTSKKCSTPDWRSPLAEALKGPIRNMKPTHVVINSGLHGSTNTWTDEKWSQTAAAGKAAVMDNHGRVFWKTTTAAENGISSRDHDAMALAAVGRSGWGVFDAYALTRPLLDLPRKPLWDDKHFEAGVYQELNLYLLNMICSPE